MCPNRKLEGMSDEAMRIDKTGIFGLYFAVYPPTEPVRGRQWSADHPQNRVPVLDHGKTKATVKHHASALANTAAGPVTTVSTTLDEDADARPIERK